MTDLLANDASYSLSPVAPREQLTSDLVAAQAEWRTRLDLPTSRDRSNDYPEYLEVWDRCEGFSEGQYHRRDVRAIAFEIVLIRSQDGL